MFGIFKNKKVILKAPLAGQLVSINDIPDEAFARKMIGDGIAIKPDTPFLLSPVNGEVVQKFSTNHALGIRTKEGLEILLHMGIDTVELNGQGFESFISEGERVSVGQRLLQIDWDVIADKAPSIISPIVITNMELVKKMEVLKEEYVKATQDLLAIEIKK